MKAAIAKLRKKKRKNNKEIKRVKLIHYERALVAAHNALADL